MGRVFVVIFIYLYHVFYFFWEGAEMQILTDRGADITPEVVQEFGITFAPLRILLDGKTYTSGVDLDSSTFYKMLDETKNFPTTSMPSAGEFADLYREMAKTDPEILSIHISSGLSGTLTAAKLGAEMVPEAKVTFWDSMTLSCPFGWQVETAARMIKSGINIETVLQKLNNMRDKVQGMFTLNDLRYLIHGGRISHISGLVASVLNIKPIIGVEKQEGKYFQVGKFFSISRAIQGMVSQVETWYGTKDKMRIQLLHGNNLDAVAQLREKLSSAFNCVFDPILPIAPVLGAHTGPSLVGLSVAPASLFES
jgi:DegV family protein with EDD domain